MHTLTNGHAMARMRAATDGHAGTICFEPIRERVAPQGCAQWWGCFEAGDVLELCACSEPSARLQVEILTQTFMPLAITTACGTNWRAQARLARGGVVYFRVHNVGFEPAQVEIALSRRKSLPVPRPERVGLLLDFFRRLRAAA